MASWNSDKNLIFFQRLKAAAVAAQNLREEGQRLRDIIALEASPGNVDNAAFVDTTIATKADAKNLIGYLGEFALFNENGVLTQFNRRDYLTPFTDTTPA
jgi:hypothetical protein